jgi:heme exporter protein D
MGTIVWTAFAVATMFAIFMGCVVVVSAGIRWLEHVLERRRLRQRA